MMLWRLLADKAAKMGDKPALVFPQRTLTFSGWWEEVRRFAGWLKEQGIEEGDAVAVFLPDCAEFAVAYFGVWVAGGVVVPIDFGAKEEALRHILEHCEAKAVLVAEKGYDAASVAGSVSSVRGVLRVPDEWGRVMDAPPQQPVEPPESAPSTLFYTSGTTGQPKAILWNYKHLKGAPMIMHHFGYVRQDDVKLCVVPFSHCGGLVYLQNAAYAGCTVHFMRRFIPGRFVEMLQKHKITCFHTVPAIFVATVMTDEFTKADLSSLRWVSNFGAMLNEEAVRRFGERCPNARLVQGWGMTESAPPNTLHHLNIHMPLKSVGVAPPWIEVAVVDEEGKKLPSGEVGEIVLRGWVVMEGYYKAPELTKQTIKEGWLHSGDLGYIDENGWLYIVGRKKDVIIVGGLNVLASEVEDVLKRYEGVADAAVVGAADRLRGEVVKAYVELEQGAKVTEGELIEHARALLEPFKVPKSVVIVERLPRTTSGKVAKWRLKEMDA